MTVMGQTKGTTRFASGLVSLMLTRLIQIGVRRLQGIIYNKGFGQYRKTISGAVLKKMYSMDMYDGEGSNHLPLSTPEPIFL